MPASLNTSAISARSLYISLLAILVINYATFSFSRNCLGTFGVLFCKVEQPPESPFIKGEKEQFENPCTI